MGSISEMLTAIPLHQRPDLLEACADLINEEWKKSKTSRLHSLQRSSDNFPTCLVLIRTPKTVEETADGKMAKSQSQLLGHARLSRVVSQPKSLFVETVVVAKALRGKGYGRKLMEAVESYATSRGYRRLHLTTHDKQHFYAHLGFVLSTPVQCAGFMSSIVPLGFLESLSPSQPGRELHAASAKHHPSASYSRRSGADLPVLPSATPLYSSSVCSPASSPRLPPLTPASSYHSASVTGSPPQPSASGFSRSSLQPVNASVPSSTSASIPLSASCYGATSLLLPPPPPPVPPSTVLSPGHADSHKPASSSPSGIKTQGQLLVDTPYRDLKGQPIFWMEKDI
ncbi:N-alpha-acetyltransferase 80 [Varanus komodoensis]|uniref:N-alpha-acetyltransferase 80 n=1 Tax=Varanus komodoensis TaxID=61221 RepID=UPI001CF77F95|nr:N-alpha-acetyltransferase 80 [Varanus komodoensis]XP_044307268.1 N-alpha-acetyltransferase 80 [Varanus komodoensis]KAF7249758.1 N-alpha-acetyltransferase 80 [Varanus komodoensis]